MVPYTAASNSLEARYTWECRNGYCRRRSSWYDWGRWIVLGIIVLLALVIFMSCACIARRRRRRGAPPVYGTGWMAPAGKPSGPAPSNYGPPPQDYHQGFNQGAYGVASPPPAYGPQQQPQYTGTTFNANDGYYAAQQPQYGGVQPPHNAYQPDTAYAPPPGPPPGK
ncbi:hypothetical protein CDD82_1517 [Ophiocordyceps australis]|uniref:Uncharacterized protein n=1 Tax=Ophiocordyceps australis TaxID=1399860 RepID=A0A2C5XC45_9HYPO|nr:hypothetical protein CDD82_1517 [Ophiocordyceps australis]